MIKKSVGGGFIFILLLVITSGYILGGKNILDVFFDIDDLEDVEEDNRTQLTPFTAFQEKHAIGETDTIISVLERIIGIRAIKKLIQEFEKNRRFISRTYNFQYRLWLEKPEYYNNRNPDAQQVYEMLADWANIVDFYFNKKMQLR